jgi:hypothetical protein
MLNGSDICDILEMRWNRFVLTLQSRLILLDVKIKAIEDKVQFKFLGFILVVRSIEVKNRNTWLVLWADEVRRGISGD